MQYPFRRWKIDLAMWITTTELDHTAIGPAIVMRLDGAPRQLGEHLAKQPTTVSDSRFANLLTHGRSSWDDTEGSWVLEHGWEILLYLARCMLFACAPVI